MGVVLKQSYKNTLTLFLAILVGAINTLFLYVYFLDKVYYGLVTFLLSTAFILMPLIALGVQYSIVKFYSGYKDKLQKDKFLSSALWIPLFIVVPIACIGTLFYDKIATLLAQENTIIKQYTFSIFLVAIATAYFEIFYAWAKVHLQSVFGNLLKELFVRVSVSILLFAVHFGWIDNHDFIVCLIGAYFMQMFIMMVYAFSIYRPQFSFALPDNFKEVVKYSLYIILAGSAATILIDIDKFMIPQKELIEQVAYYSVAVYIGSIIEIPGRAMAQIIQPLTSKAINQDNWGEVKALYQKSHINLLLIAGLIFVLVNSNITYLYMLLPENFSGGIWVVLMISTAKLYHMFLGNNGAIISNSSKYKILLPYGLGMATMVIVLNHFLIDALGISGAALATLLVVLVFNTIKIWYVKSTFSLLPFQGKTWISVFFIGIITFLGKEVNTYIYHPVIAMLIKSIVLIVVYLIGIYALNLSVDIKCQLDKIHKKILGN